MAKLNEPQRVITRGKTRVMGAPRAQREADKGGLKGEPRVSTGAPNHDNGQGRVSQGEARRPAPRTVPEGGAPAPMRTVSERRPVERIDALEVALDGLHAANIIERLTALELALYGAAPAEGEPEPVEIGLVAAVADLEAVNASFAATVGDLVDKVGSAGTTDQPGSGLVHAVAELSDTVVRFTRDTVPPSPELEGEG